MVDQLLRNRELAFWLTVFSITSFVASAILVPMLCVRIDSQHFLTERTHCTASGIQNRVLRTALLVLKSLIGALLIGVGILMLVLPGQGLISILAGLFLLQFPGKRRVELWLLRLPGVLRAINSLRARAKHPPLEMPPVEY
jgi:hypothetical protein